MKNNSKTLTIEKKKLWIIGLILSLLASIYPSLMIAPVSVTIATLYQNPNATLFDIFKFFFPGFFVIFFLFVVVFILLCKWQSKK